MHNVPTRVLPMTNASPALEDIQLIVSKLPFFIYEGEEGVMQVSCEPAEASVSVFWSSDDESVATVSDRGVVKGVSPGSTLIRATVWDNVNMIRRTAMYLVTISKAPTAIDDVQSKPFAVRMEGGALRVEGLARGEAVRVYDAAGRLVAETRAEGATASVALGGQGGVYVVRTDGGRAAKVVVRR